MGPRSSLGFSGASQELASIHAGSLCEGMGFNAAHEADGVVKHNCTCGYGALESSQRLVALL